MDIKTTQSYQSEQQNKQMNLISKTKPTQTLET